MSPELPRASAPWKLVFATVVGLSALRAAFFALKDGYIQAELYDLAVTSTFRHFCVGLAVVSTWSLAVACVAPRVRARSFALVTLCIVATVLDYLFLTGRLPSLPLHAPAFEGAKAWGVHASALVASVVAGTAVAFPHWFAPRVANASMVAAVALLVTTSGVRLFRGDVVRASSTRPNVILISIDTVRADRLGAYGYSRPTTPAIDAFARESVRFERAFCPQTWTLTSHMTLLTSLYPTTHGVDTHRLLPAGVRTLASLLSAEGYRTAAQVDRVVWLEEKYGFDRGFDVYRRVAGTADRKNAYLASLLDDLEGAPFFLLLHYFDAHSDFAQLPYEAPSVDREAFTGDYRGSFTGCDESRRCGSRYLMALNEEGRKPAPEDLAYIGGLYDAGLRSLDRELGRLFDDLRARGLYDTSIIVLTADHGEELGEHGMFLHEQVYEECVAVPLCIRLPGGSRAGVATPVVGLIDVAPTVLDLCGFAPPPEMQGRSLKPVMLGDERAFDRDGVLLDGGEGRYGLRTREWKLFDDGERWHLYDLLRDPEEQNDVFGSAEHAATIERLTRQLAAERARVDSAKSRLSAGAPRTKLTEAELSEVRSLGYAGKE